MKLNANKLKDIKEAVESHLGLSIQIGLSSFFEKNYKDCTCISVEVEDNNVRVHMNANTTVFNRSYLSQVENMIEDYKDNRYDYYDIYAYLKDDYVVQLFIEEVSDEIKQYLK